jgi:ABC-type nitrate/sulfonate/bicarbonate transport system substrate-binding protein
VDQKNAFKIWTFACVAGLVGAGILAALWYWPSQRPDGGIEKLTLGVATGGYSALIYVAEKKNLFRKQGLDVSIRDFQAGAMAVDGLVADQVDVATASGFVLVRESFERNDVRAFAAISAARDVELVGNTLKGIKTPEDLRGKKIGTLSGSVAEFFLGTWLTDYGISIKDEIQLVHLQPSQLAGALAQGRIDAAAVFAPFSFDTKNALKGTAFAWPLQGGRDYYFLLITKEPWIKDHPAGPVRLLKALLEAERFLNANKREAQAIVEERLKITHPTLLSVWEQNEFSLQLNQDLLILMEDEARWLIQRNRTPKSAVPNYLNFFYLDAIDKVKPEAVNLIH